MDNTQSVDDLLTRIIALEKNIEEKRTLREKLVPEARDAQKIRDDFKIFYEEAQKRFWASQQELDRREREIRGLDAESKETKEELARLRREFNRRQDAIKLNANYQKQVEEFKNRCLDAPWRKENRTDGLGALEYQIDGAVHLALTGQTLLGDDRGMGKTLTALIALDLREARKVIAIVPADIIENFLREVAKWAPHRSPINLYGMNRGQRDFMLRALKGAPEFMVVVNYEGWRSDTHLIEDLAALQADALVLDEAHKGKTMSSIQGKGIQQLRYYVNTCPDCQLCDIKFDGSMKPAEEYKCWCGKTGPITDFCSIKTVIPMSGTFILNRPQELYPMLRMVDIKNFSSEKDYLKDFCRKVGPSTWKWVYNGEKDLMKKIGPRYMARTRAMVGDVMPPPDPIEHFIPMAELLKTHPNQHEAYKQIKEFMEIAFTEEATMKMPEVIVRLMRMRQVLVWPAAIEFKERDDLGNVKRTFSLDVCESWKLDKAEELIRDINEEGKRVVVFSQFKPGIHELQRRFGSRTAIYDGSASKGERNAIQLDFDASTAPMQPRWDNVVCSYRAAGEGLNFNTASDMIFLDREWSPGKEAQAIGRMDRLGQTQSTRVHFLTVGSSVDSWMKNLIDSKSDMISGFNDEALSWKDAFNAFRNGEM